MGLRGLQPSILIIILLLSIGLLNGEDPCKFTLQDIPEPDDLIIVGDVRKLEACQKTSFTQSKPPDLFDPTDGKIRLWTQEEHLMSQISNQTLRDVIWGRWSTGTYFISEYSKLMARDSIAYIQTPKTGLLRDD